MSLFTIGWIGLLVYFAVLEFIAIKRPEGGDTLSEHLRLWFSTKATGKFWWQRRLILALFFLWFIPHIFLDGPGPL